MLGQDPEGPAHVPRMDDIQIGGDPDALQISEVVTYEDLCPSIKDKDGRDDQEVRISLHRGQMFT